MRVNDLKQEIEEMLDGHIGIMLYAVLKTVEGKEIKFINIADEGERTDNTSTDLQKGFVDVLKNKLAVYSGEADVLKLSSADERKNALYYYDLDEYPLEMEMLKSVSEISSVKTTFDFKEDKLSQIVALIVVIGNANKKIVLYKQQYPISLLSRDRYMLTPVPHKNRMERFRRDILRIDFNCHFFLWNGIVYISDIEKMETICSFYEIIVKEAQKSIQEIDKMQILDSIESLTDELGNLTFARKLTRIYKDSKVLGQVSNHVIIDFSKKHNYCLKNPIKLTASGDKFILDTKKAREAFIKLMSDDLLTSQLTNADYEALAKNST